MACACCPHCCAQADACVPIFCFSENSCSPGSGSTLPHPAQHLWAAPPILPSAGTATVRSSDWSKVAGGGKVRLICGCTTLLKSQDGSACSSGLFGDGMSGEDLHNKGCQRETPHGHVSAATAYQLHGHGPMELSQLLPPAPLHLPAPGARSSPLDPPAPAVRPAPSVHLSQGRLPADQEWDGGLKHSKAE